MKTHFKIYVYLQYTDTSENLYTKKYLNIVGNLEEKLGLPWQGEKWGENV